MLVKPSTVIVKDGLERFRKEMGELEELANSIRIHGQIQPIVVNQKMELIAGGRRLAACTLYNMDVEVKIIDENDPIAMRELEVEENVQRKDFTPAEHVLAVKELHEIKSLRHISQANNTLTGTTWTMEDTAKLIGKDRSSVSKDLDLAEMVTAFPSLGKCKTKKELSQAAQSLMKLVLRAESINEYEQNIVATDRVELYNMDAKSFMQLLLDNSVDIILCDPPYGINISDVAIGIGGETGATNNQGFEFGDSAADALGVIEDILAESIRVCKDSAHLYIFCAPEYFRIIQVMCAEVGWECHVRPLIWDKPGGGQSNIPERWPISSYEMCLYARRVNSKLINARADVLHYSRVSPNAKIHPTQKPVDLLQDLIQRCVLPGATLIDPCMGSGSAIVAGLKEKLICKGNDVLKQAYTAATDFVNAELENGND